MTATITGFAVSFFILLILLRGVERLSPRERRLPISRTGFWTDATYWVFTQFVTKGLPHVVAICSRHGGGNADLRQDRPGIACTRLRPFSRLPLWQKVATGCFDLGAG